ncbi:MAG TPA: aminotransferase class I/II-fold pyridoxal phosphate-dependent enzyme [Mycobacteriales bacterium]|nr:aminotransferase class I/II-fold pyridoxal phosphate-dependent enzyme [Mycobacteriales bacterium]
MSTVLRASMRRFGTSIFSTITDLAVQRQAINLAQGFPDFDPPRELLDAAAAAVHGGFSQYAPSIGYPDLRRAVAAHQATHYDQQWDPDTEITITVGATEAIWSAVHALIEPGDEVLLVEPCYDMYQPCVVAAGGVPRILPTTGFPDFRIDPDRLAAAFGPRTRLAIVNTPWNPVGRQLTAAELRALGELCQRYGAHLISDETYEHVLFDGRTHRPAVSEPLLADRTITVSSVSKTFSATGWRIGWAVAPAGLTEALRRVHQFVTFTAASPLQRAVAVMLAGSGPEFYAQLTAEYTERRDTLLEYLAKRDDLELTTPEGAYFVMTRCAGDELEFCRELIDRSGVAAIPASAFFADPATGRGLVRFAFCKRLETLRLAGERLAAH